MLAQVNASKFCEVVHSCTINFCGLNCSFCRGVFAFLIKRHLSSILYFYTFIFSKALFRLLVPLIIDLFTLDCAYSKDGVVETSFLSSPVLMMRSDIGFTIIMMTHLLLVFAIIKIRMVFQ